MKKIILLLILSAASFSLSAQERLFIHKSDNITLGVPTSMTDSIYFSNDGNITFFRIGDTLAQYATTIIDSLTFGTNSNTIYIRYNGTGVSVINPLAFEGVKVTVSGANVIVSSSTETQDLIYNLSGTTTNGMFKIYSAKRYNLVLNGVTITNPVGPAINLQSEKKASVELVAGKVNSLTDGVTYATAPLNGSGQPEDQKATFFSEAKLVFSGTGSLIIAGNGSDQHALCSDDVIEIDGGSISVTKAAKDGIHGQDGIEITGGTVSVASTGDAIDADKAYIKITGGSITTTNTQPGANGITCDSTLTVTGGTLNLSVSGTQSKALHSKQAMTLSGGNITIHNSGNVVLAASGSGYNPVYCHAVKSSSVINLNGSNLTITSSGNGAKSIASDGNILMTAGTICITNSGVGAAYVNTQGVASAYVPACFSANGNISISGGSLTTSCSGAAGRSIIADGTLTIGSSSTNPTLNLTTTGSSVYVSGSGSSSQYAEAKAISCDGVVSVQSGSVTIVSADDGIHSKSGIIVSGGTLNATASGDGLDAGDGTIVISGGNITTSNSKADTKGITCNNTISISGGTLNLTVSGNQSKALQCDLAMTLSGGNITIHNSGAVVLTPSGSGYDPSYCCAVKSGSSVNLTGANLSITSSNSGARSVVSEGNITMTGGTVSITNSGAGARYTNPQGVYDVYIPTCLRADGNISITAGTLTTSSSGAAGRGITTNGTLTVGTTSTAPTISVTTTGTSVYVSGSGPNADYVKAKAIKCDGAATFESGTITVASADDAIKSGTSVTFNNASVTISNSFESVEAPFITINGGTVNAKSSDDCINATFGNGGENDDGSLLKVTGGMLIADASGNDCLDSNGSMLFTGGTVIGHGPQSAPEVGMDFNGTCKVNGGFLVVSGTNSNMTYPPSTTSTQRCVLAKTTTSIAAGTLFHVQDASGNDIVTFQPVRRYYSMIFSSSSLQSGGSYSIYTGGTCTGTNNNGLYTGGTYSGGTFRKTFSISSMITTVTF